MTAFVSIQHLLYEKSGELLHQRYEAEQGLAGKEDRARRARPSFAPQRVVN